jgi:superoxide dismutase, Cu-Zn family
MPLRRRCEMARPTLAPILLLRATLKRHGDTAMKQQVSLLLAAAVLAVGCAPDTPESNSTGRADDRGALPRAEQSQRPVADGREADGAIRPPTTTTSPAEPGAAPPAALPRLLARAQVQPLADNTVRGIVEFQTAADGDGPLTIHVMLMGLDAGPHGMHVHAGTDCAAPGDHLNPLNTPHGPQNAGAAARHRGDLGNVTADASGMVEEMLRDAELAGDSSFIGKVIIVHKDQDDLTTQPGGDSGEPIACGVIERAEDVISRGDGLDRGV